MQAIGIIVGVIAALLGIIYLPPLWSISIGIAVVVGGLMLAKG